jgi:hypothetical protein
MAVSYAPIPVIPATATKPLGSTRSRGAALRRPRDMRRLPIRGGATVRLAIRYSNVTGTCLK